MREAVSTILSERQAMREAVSTILSLRMTRSGIKPITFNSHHFGRSNHSATEAALNHVQ